MIAIAIILSLSFAFIAALCLYWRNILEWIKKAANKIKEVLGITVQGTRTFISKSLEGSLEGFKNISKYYSENNLTGEWEETVYTKSVSRSEIPPEILAKVDSGAFDTEISTTEELQLILTN